MGCSDFLRMQGIIAHFVAIILFLVSMGTVNWMSVKHFDGSAGLWQCCDLHINDSQLHGNRTTGSANGLLGVSSTTTRSTTTERDQQEEDQDQCFSYGVIGVDGYLHVVRLLVIFALFCFAYGFCKGTTIRVKIEYHPSFHRQHTGELLSLLGAVLALLSVEVYGGQFKEDTTLIPYLKGLQGPEGETGGELMRLGWSSKLMRSTSFVLVPAVFFMLAPTLNEKFGFCDDRGSGGGWRGGAGESGASAPRRFLASLLRFVSCSRPPQSQTAVRSETRTSTAAVELSARSPSPALTESSGGSASPAIFTIFDDQREGGVRGSNSEPAPRYEDLPPLPPSAPTSSDISSLPPPPSYDDVLKGLYVTTPLSAPAPPPPPPYTDSPPPSPHPPSSSGPPLHLLTPATSLSSHTEHSSATCPPRAENDFQASLAHTNFMDHTASPQQASTARFVPNSDTSRLACSPTTTENGNTSVMTSYETSTDTSRPSSPLSSTSTSSV